jgi:hypothetical protein
MPNLLSASQIASYKDAFDSIHETFGRDVIIVKEPKRVVVQELDANYNYFYSRSEQSSVKEEFIPVSGVFKMRIQWQDPSKELFGAQTSDVRPKIHDNTCRLKMKRDAYNFINGYKSFIIDGRSCEWVGFSKPHGIVGVDFYTIFVKETN